MSYFMWERVEFHRGGMACIHLSEYMHLLVNFALLCYTVELTCGFHEFMSEKWLEQCSAQGRPSVSRDRQSRTQGLWMSRIWSAPSLMLLVGMRFPSPHPARLAQILGIQFTSYLLPPGNLPGPTSHQLAVSLHNCVVLSVQPP